MAGGSKRGGFRGGNSGGFKKGYAKKRSADDEEDAPQSKKSKGDDNDEEDATPLVPQLQTDDDDNSFVALNNSGKRRVTVSDFKGATLISIREYWTNDAGELKPGKKGISLSVDQYNALLAAAPLLESVLVKKDLQVARPNYEADIDNAATAKGEGEGGSVLEAADEEDEE
ncbi:hypothetical protein E8E13_008922 [Curvularia kusanoi]|uniref:Transcriptional coactivator p15 (PC4) C-terminal domain-containing protein n=1 Tax=Curvularia kusanoi TaxID=90978 RepID=A0A9P4TPV9_CURKU|nr:hypothetical protein E8E13_008922 [Curvularia kusanoi]